MRHAGTIEFLSIPLLFISSRFSASSRTVCCAIHLASSSVPEGRKKGDEIPCKLIITSKRRLFISEFYSYYDLLEAGCLSKQVECQDALCQRPVRESFKHEERRGGGKANPNVGILRSTTANSRPDSNLPLPALLIAHCWMYSLYSLYSLCSLYSLAGQRLSSNCLYTSSHANFYPGPMIGPRTQG